MGTRELAKKLTAKDLVRICTTTRDDHPARKNRATLQAEARFGITSQRTLDNGSREKYFHSFVFIPSGKLPVRRTSYTRAQAKRIVRALKKAHPVQFYETEND